MTVEEKVGQLMLALVHPDRRVSHVSFGAETTVFQERMFKFKVTRIRGGQSYVSMFMASETQLNSMSDPLVVADAMVADLDAQQKK